MKRVLALGFVSALLGCASMSPPGVQVPGPVAAVPIASVQHLVVVGTSDLHGWFAGHDEKVPYGGLPLFASYVEALRAANAGHVVVLDSGDLFQGTLESNEFEGEPVVRAYNAIGYTAAAVGNHEFDYGPVGPDSVPRDPGEDPLGALKRNASLATFPFLAANMVDRVSGSIPPWAKASILVDVAGVKLGIIGLGTPSTPVMTMAVNVRSLAFNDPVAATVREAAELRARGADVVVVIAHMGGRCTDRHDVHDVASCDPDQEVMRYLAALPARTIDACLAAHTHQEIRQYINGIPVLESLPYGREFGTLDLWVDPAAHRVTKSELRPLTMVCAQVFAGTETCDARAAPAGAQLVPRLFEGRAIAPAESITRILQPYLVQVEAKREEPVNIRIARQLDRAFRRESTLGDLMADALRQRFAADIAIVNSGAIRADLHAGELRYRDLFELSPFDSYVAEVTMTGAEVAEALRLATTSSSIGIPQVSGIRYTLDLAKDSDKPQAQRSRIVALTLASGRPLDPSAPYRVVLPDFLVSGGAGMGAIFRQIGADRIKIRYDLPPLRDVLIPVLQRYPQPITAKPLDRIIVLNDTHGPDADG